VYKAAGLDLARDLDTLDTADRVAAKPAAARYLLQNFTPNGYVSAPVLTMHTIGDGLTSPSLALFYAQMIARMSGPSMVARSWVERAGHCNFTGPELVAAVNAVEDRIATGRWHASPATLNRSARTAGATADTFVSHTPQPMLRPCRAKNDRCAEDDWPDDRRRRSPPASRSAKAPSTMKRLATARS
jgi:hypothetical protein